MAAHFDQRVMICCKFLHFSPAIGFSRQLLACSVAFVSVSDQGSSEWNEVNFHHNKLPAIVFESANNREMKYGMSIHWISFFYDDVEAKSRIAGIFQTRHNRRGHVIRNPGKKLHKRYLLNYSTLKLKR